MRRKRVRLDTVIIFTQRMAELAEFYRRGLDYDGELQESPGHLGFPLENGVYLGFDQTEKEYEQGGVSLWFAVADLDAAFRRFVGAGASVRYARKELPTGDVLASLLDPDGNILGLVER
jgi:predicted enzyme related to lactoylglutathione lyase